MSAHSPPTRDAVVSLFTRLLESWNSRDAAAFAGMVPPGATALKPERNTIQSIVAVREGDGARIALFQNTPARFDGRPELAERLTAELTVVRRAGRVVDTG